MSVSIVMKSRVCSVLYQDMEVPKANSARLIGSLHSPIRPFLRFAILKRRREQSEQNDTINKTGPSRRERGIMTSPCEYEGLISAGMVVVGIGRDTIAVKGV